MIELSMCGPFRKRHWFLDNAFKTFMETVHDPKKIEILLAMDYDDEIGNGAIDGLRQKYPDIQIIIKMCGFSEDFVNQYCNPLAVMARGRWIMAFTDDALFVTPKWDKLIIDRMTQKAESIDDDIWFGLVKDGLARIGEDKLFPNFTCWPVISKEHVDALGYMYHPHFIMNGADHFIAEVYKGLNRRVSLTHVFIDHDSPHTMKRPHDEDWTRIQDMNMRNHRGYTKEMVEQEIIKLSDYIKNKKH